MEGFSLPFEDPVLVFGTVMLIILLAPLAARKAGLPGIIGLIAAGILVGPHGVGLLERGQSIQLLGKVGLLYIMFLAGLEIDLHQVRKKKTHTLLFGGITFLIPLILGTLLGYLVFGMTLPVAVLLASMFSSHTLLTFPVLGKLGLSRNRAVTATVGGTIITDTLALIILAVIVGSSSGNLTPLFWVRLFSLIIVYMAAVLFLVPLLGRWAFRRMGDDEELEYVFVMALTLFVSYLAHLAGLEPIIGAFLAGLSLNSMIPEKSLLMTRIHFIGNTIFVPFFLVSVGMLVNLRLLVSGPDVWIVILGMAGVAVFSKYLAAKASALLLRYSKSEGTLIFGLSVNQAAATLAAVLIGYNAGLFELPIITGTIMMIAVTCLVGSIVTQRAGKRLVLQEEQAEYDESTAPHRILLPLADRSGSKDLLDLVLLLRRKENPEPVYPLRVIRESMNLETDLAEAEKILTDTVVRTISADVPVTPLTVVDINEASGIIRAARDNRISLIVFRWDGIHRIGARIFGHTLDEVIDRTHHMILANRVMHSLHTARRMIVLVSPGSHRHRGYEKSITLVKTLAGQAGTGIILSGSPEGLEASREIIPGIKPRVPVQFYPISLWKSVTDTMENLLRPGDWIFLLSARKGDVSWQPSLDKLPKRMSQQFPEHSFSILYPPTLHWDRGQAAELTTTGCRLIKGFSPEGFLFNQKAVSLKDLLGRLLAGHFRDAPAVIETVTGILWTIALEEPVQLTPGVVLLHTHLPLVKDTLFFLGVNKTPLKLSSVPDPCSVVIILLDPLDQDPTKHLNALTDIVRIISLPGMPDMLKEMDNFDSFSRALAKLLDAEEGNS